MSPNGNSTRNAAAKPLLLVAANIVGIMVGYAITLVLARNLPQSDFEQYVGTIAVLSLVAALAEAGFGKYGLKVIPVYEHKQTYGLLRGYLAFSAWGCLLLSLFLGLAVILLETPIRDPYNARIVYWAVLALPCLAGQGVALDILMAFRRAVTATLIARIVIPSTTLLVIFLWTLKDWLDAEFAVIGYGLGSICGLTLALILCRLKARPLVHAIEPKMRLREWSVCGAEFMTFTFLMAWLFKAPLILIHHLPHSANELALFAPAFETGCLILLIAKATDKYFQPAMSIVIDSEDWLLGRSLRKRRLAFVGAGICVYLTIIFLFGQQILGLYGPGFKDAYGALCVVAVGSSFWTLYSLAPSFLLFVGKRRALLFNLIGHGTLLVLLTLVLFPRYGVFGSAVAYAISVSAMALWNVYLGRAIYLQNGASPPVAKTP